MVIRSFGPYRRNEIINPPDGQANLLIRQGFVSPHKQVAETQRAKAVVESSRKNWKR